MYVDHLRTIVSSKESRANQTKIFDLIDLTWAHGPLYISLRNFMVRFDRFPVTIVYICNKKNYKKQKNNRALSVDGKSCFVRNAYVNKYFSFRF